MSPLAKIKKEKDSDIPDVVLAPYKGISYGEFLKLKKREGQEVVLRGNLKQIIGSAVLKAGEQQLASLVEGSGIVTESYRVREGGCAQPPGWTGGPPAIPGVPVSCLSSPERLCKPRWVRPL